MVGLDGFNVNWCYRSVKTRKNNTLLLNLLSYKWGFNRSSDKKL